MPVTHQSKEFKDISLSFKTHPVTNDILVLKNSDAIKKSVMNLVKTHMGDRFYEKNIGTKITSYLFENYSENNQLSISRQIDTVIRNYEPRVKIEKTTVNPDPDNNSLEVRIRYKIIGQPDTLENIQFLIGN